MLKNKWIKIAVAAVLIFSSSVFALNVTLGDVQENNNFIKATDQVAIHQNRILLSGDLKSSGTTNVKTSLLKETPSFIDLNYGDWRMLLEKIVIEKSGKQLSKETIAYLYEKGYSLDEIEKAESLSILCDKSVEEILQIKKNTQAQSNSIISSEIWGEVEKKIGVDIVSRMKKLKLPEKIVKALKDKYFSDDQIVEIGVLTVNYGLNPSKIVSDMESGLTYEQLDRQYWEERKNKIKSEESKKILSQKDLENTIRIKNGITDSDISLCKSYGISQVIEVGFAKDLANKYKTELKHVAQLKKEKKLWSKVISVLEEEKR